MSKSKRKKLSKRKGIRYWKKKAWEAFSQYIRLKSALDTTGTPETLICCSCGKHYPAFGKGCAQAGHFVPGRRNAILFDERGVHGQCYNCNQTLKGNWPGYMRFMLDKYGQETVDDLLRLNETIRRYEVFELQELCRLYEDKVKELKGIT